MKNTKNNYFLLNNPTLAARLVRQDLREMLYWRLRNDAKFENKEAEDFLNERLHWLG